jgi:hypothetical protein
VARTPSTTVIGKAFVSFRVGDAEDTAMLIDQRLCRSFGADRVFRSSRAMHGGALFPPTLEAEAAGCAIMVVVIGRRWLAAGGGRRRIDDPQDWVRREIEFALHNDRPVLLVLTADAPELGPRDVPATMTGLVDRPQLRFRSAERDLARIADEVRPHMHGVVRPDRPVHLTDLRPTHRSAGVRLGSAEITGDHHDHSIMCVAGTVSYDLGMRFRRLETTTAVLKSELQSGVFTVLGDGRTLAQVTTTAARPRKLTVDVTDVLTLRLSAHHLAGSEPDALPELVWGDPVVHP